MGAYLGVQQGSMFPPQFIHLTYKPENPTGDVVKVIRDEMRTQLQYFEFQLRPSENPIFFIFNSQLCRLRD